MADDQPTVRAEARRAFYLGGWMLAACSVGGHLNAAISACADAPAAAALWGIGATGAALFAAHMWRLADA